MRPHTRSLAVLLCCVALLACAGGCGVARAAHDGERVPLAADEPLFPAATSAVSLPTASPSPNLGQLVDRFADATGWTLFVDAGARARLDRTPIAAAVPREIPAADVYRTVETQLAEQRFAISVLSDRAPRILRIVDLDGPQGARTLNHNVREVDTRELDMLGADHPALAVRSVLTVEHGDARTIANGLRATLDQSTTQMLAPLGNTKQMLVIGLAPWARRTRDLVLAADSTAAPARR